MRLVLGLILVFATTQAVAQIPVQPLITDKEGLGNIFPDLRGLPVILTDGNSATDCDPATATGPFVVSCYWCEGPDLWQVPGTLCAAVVADPWTDTGGSPWTNQGGSAWTDDS